MSTEYRMRDMVFYDDDGNEIPDEELPWSSNAKEIDPCDDSQDWVYQDDGDSTEDSLDTPVLAEKSKSYPEDTRSAAERRKRVAQSVREEALRRLELSARTAAEFQSVAAGMIEKSRAGCAGSAGMKVCAATHPWNTSRLPMAALCRTA